MKYQQQDQFSNFITKDENTWSNLEDKKMIGVIQTLQDYNWSYISFVMKKSTEECISRWKRNLFYKVPDRPYDEKDRKLMLELFHMLQTDWQTISFIVNRNIYSVQKYYLKIIKKSKFYDYIVSKEPKEYLHVHDEMLKIIKEFSKLSKEEKTVVSGLLNEFIEKNM